MLDRVDPLRERAAPGREARGHPGGPRHGEQRGERGGHDRALGAREVEPRGEREHGERDEEAEPERERHHEEDDDEEPRLDARGAADERQVVEVVDDERQPPGEQEDDHGRGGRDRGGERRGEHVGEEGAARLRVAGSGNRGVARGGERPRGLVRVLGEARAREREVHVGQVGGERDGELRVGDRAGREPAASAREAARASATASAGRFSIPSSRRAQEQCLRGGVRARRIPVAERAATLRPAIA